jgi:multidrug efflux pump subunit AcrB
VLAFNPPAIRGLGTAGGFEVYVQDRTGADPQRLSEVVQGFMAALAKRPELTGLNTFFRPATPQVFVEVDRQKALALGVPVDELFESLQGTMGALYVNDFNLSGRTFRVQLQAEAPYRSTPEDLGEVYVRSTGGEMLPLKTLIRVERRVGAEQLERFNAFLGARIIGSGAPGVSSGEAIRIVEEVAAESLPQGYAYAWTGQAFQEKRIGRQSTVAFAFALVMVFLILAAQFERWSLPLAVILAVPFAVVGALAAVWLRGMENDIYFQIGLVTLIGLAAKNAILIVEFAVQKMQEGRDVVDAAIEGARLRYRPIVMTSMAFMLGVLPLAIASGAGAAARRSMGTGVLGGMLLATFVATLFIPLFFAVLSRSSKPKAVTEDTERHGDHGEGRAGTSPH